MLLFDTTDSMRQLCVALLEASITFWYYLEDVRLPGPTNDFVDGWPDLLCFSSDEEQEEDDEEDEV